MEEITDKTLNILKRGQKTRVIQVKGKGTSRKSLLDMGMIPGSVLSVRKQEAEMVVEALED